MRAGKTRKVTEMGRLITRGEFMANTRANNERIVAAFNQFDARLRMVEAALGLQGSELALVKDEEQPPQVPA